MDSRKSVIRVLLLIAATQFGTCSAFTSALEKTKLDGLDTHDVEIYIEQRIHHIHAKIDLKQTITGLLTLEKCILKMEKGSADTLSFTLHKFLTKRVDRIVLKLKRVSPKSYLSNRDKRAIEFLGDLISDIFGNPGPSDWKKVNSNLIALQNALKRVNDNSADEHKEIDFNRNAIERHNTVLKELSKSLDRNMNELNNIEKEFDSLKIFFQILTFADAIENQIDYLVEIKLDSVKGYCSDRAIDKEFLTENLQNLESNRAGLGPVFGSWEWREYYRHEFCTVALDNDAVWVSLRIPLVRKSEKLVRVIPTPAIASALSLLGNYGIDLVMFREKENDKYHVLTQASFDLCNRLGNIRTCGVRDVRFSGSPLLVPIEFARNRFLIVGQTEQTKLLAKCPEGITEHLIIPDVVLSVPDNCSYISNAFSLDAREADIDITKQLGIMQVERFEMISVHDFKRNSTHVKIEEIVHQVGNRTFEKRVKEINDLLGRIDTKHENLSNSYSLEKWLFVGGLLALAMTFGGIQFCKCRKAKPGGQNTFELRTVNVIEQQHQQQGQNQLQQQQLQPHVETTDTDKQRQITHSDKPNPSTEHDYQEVLSFSSPPEKSQFYSK